MSSMKCEESTSVSSSNKESCEGGLTRSVQNQVNLSGQSLYNFNEDVEDTDAVRGYKSIFVDQACQTIGSNSLIYSPIAQLPDIGSILNADTAQINVEAPLCSIFQARKPLKNNLLEAIQQPEQRTCFPYNNLL